MKKISNSKIYVVAITIFLCVTIALLIRILTDRREALAQVSATDVPPDVPILYSDSTYMASSWLWEFGNGDVSESRYGEYTYSEPGHYRIRLTVDNAIEKNFRINVRKPVRFENDSLVRISAPKTAIQGEYIVFKGIGYAREWRWAFGATRLTDSREQVTIYSYDRPGFYEVELMTEDTKYPVRHSINIIPKYMEEENDERIRMGNDIREKLQAIVDGKPFGPNYNHIRTRYLCNNPNIIITINESKNNDFYSYCQGLKIIDRRNTTILEVIVFPDENNNNCLKTFKVIQVKNEE